MHEFEKRVYDRCMTFRSRRMPCVAQVEHRHAEDQGAPAELRVEFDRLAMSAPRIYRGDRSTDPVRVWGVNRVGGAGEQYPEVIVPLLCWAAGGYLPVPM